MKKLIISFFFIFFSVYGFCQTLQFPAAPGTPTSIPTAPGGTRSRLYSFIPVKDTLNNPATSIVGAFTIRPQDTVTHSNPTIYMSNGRYWNPIGGGIVVPGGIDSTTFSDNNLCFWKLGIPTCYFLTPSTGGSSDSLALNFDSTWILHYRNGAALGDSIYLIHTTAYAGSHFSITPYLDGKLFEPIRLIDSVYVTVDSQLVVRYVDGHLDTIPFVGSGGGGGGSGTVESFSSGNLSPLFTTSVATSTTTPALTFNASTAAPYTFLGRASGTGAYSFISGMDSNWIPQLHSQTYYDLRYAAFGSGGTGTVTSIGLTSSDITVGGSSPITTSGTYTLTLPTVNSNVGTWNNVTVTGKGLITAGSNVSYLTANQSITVTATGDATGTSTSSATAPSLPLVLATVNSNVGSFTNANVTVNAKGLVTAVSNGSGGTFNAVYGQTFTGSTSTTLTLSQTYTSGTIRVWKNGVRLYTTDFTEATGTTITLNVARLSYDSFTVDFNY